MTVAHLQQRRQCLVRLKREEFHVGQAANAYHFFQPRFSTALPDNHKHPWMFVQQLSRLDHALQPLLFTDIA